MIVSTPLASFDFLAPYPRPSPGLLRSSEGIPEPNPECTYAGMHHGNAKIDRDTPFSASRSR